MEGRRAAWLVSAVLLLCAGLATGWATYLWWLPCRGAMLVGTILQPQGGAEIPEACYERMDQGLPLDGLLAGAPAMLDVLTGVALLAAALAWLVLVVRLPWGRADRWYMVPLAAAFAVAALCALIPGRASSFPLFTVLLVVDGAILLAASGLAIRVVRRDLTMGYVWIPLLAVGTLGFVARMSDYLVMILWSQLNWDTPPGTGYLGAGALVLAAIVMAVTAMRHVRTSSDPEQRRGQRRTPEVGSLPA